MLSRRRFVQTTLASSLAAMAGAVPAGQIAHGTIARSGEHIPAIGMGTWLTFDVADSPHELAIRTKVLEAFFAAGGTVIDSSPMYGSSQAALGHCLNELRPLSGLFAATKIWTPSKWLGLKQISHASSLWGVEKFDLVQVHNLLRYEAHLETLFEQRETGQLRYVGVTTSHGRRHQDLMQILRTQPIDFIQLTYNIVDREAEFELLPAAQEAGVAVIANRPFRASRLFDRVRDEALPGWAADIDCHNWAQLFLKFVIAHPAVTCAIPATSRVDHMLENMGALRGRMPSAGQRRAMAVYYSKL